MKSRIDREKPIEDRVSIKHIQQVAKASAQFLNFVKEVSDPFWSGVDFIDFTLLCIHCPAFHDLTVEEASELIQSLGFVVLKPDGVDFIEHTFALTTLYDEEILKEKVKEYMEAEDLQ